MNDFTKEELEDLATWGDAYTEFGCSWVEKMHRPLIDKIQRMIENYDTPECQHEFYEHQRMGSICKKCGEFYR